MMVQGMTAIVAWVKTYQALVWWLGALSVVMFVGTLIVVPWLIVRIPADYFLRDRHQHRQQPSQHPVLRVGGMILKNVFGGLFVLAGLAMLVLPGQGVATILIGLMMMNFPGKHALERAIVQQPTVLRALNWIRTRAYKLPLVVPERPFASVKPVGSPRQT